MALIRWSAWCILAAAAATGTCARAEETDVEARVRERSAAIYEKVVAWRRDIHQHPELGGQETRTSTLVADHLKRLGLEVHTGIARTGVVGVLKGDKPGGTVALRADMDALPVKEPEGLPFASTATGTYLGQKVPLMHACGHDTHTAMLMGAAEVLAGMKDELPGTVMFIFQPAEEGPSLFPPGTGQTWGAKRMLKEGLFARLKPDAIFALHVMPGPPGEISYRSGAVTASSDDLEIVVKGRQGHGGMPWNTIDPITTSALIVTGLQTVVSRRADLTKSPAIVTIGTINGGSRANIVPDSVTMTGTIRTHNEAIREQVARDVRLTAEKIAESQGAKAQVAVTKSYAVTVNDESLTQRMLPALKRAADGRVSRAPLSGASEDFSFFAREAPGLYVFLGVTPADQDPATAAPNHNPNFFVDEAALETGTRVLGTLAVDFLASKPAPPEPEQSRPFVQEQR
jgi:amidohydrolase